MVSRLLSFGVVAALAGCVAETPPNEMPPPDPSKIIVFFPIDGEVRGRGSAGALAPGASHVYIAAHPSPSRETLPANADGSFVFAIRAGSSDVLEFAGAKDEEALDRGAATFIRVPATRVFNDEYYCCKPQGSNVGRCVAASEDKPVCGGDIPPIFQCRDNAGCAVHSGRTIDFSPDAIEVTPPDEDRMVTIRSLPNKLPARSLVQVENRGTRAIGGADPRRRTSEICDDNGEFTVSFPARGDDELVFQIYEFDGLRSREHAILVPDSQLKGVDIVGVYPFVGLQPGHTGQVAVRFSPFGVDGRGICPNSDVDPILCFTGGLGHEMVSLDRVVIDSTPVTGDVRATAPTEQLPNTRATDGDVLGGPQLLMLVVDASAKARNTYDPEGARFRAATDFVNALRARDRLGIMSVGGGQDAFELEIGPTDNKETLLSILDGLEGRAPSGVLPDIFGAIKAVADLFRASPGFDRGRILVLTTQPPSGDRDAADEALAVVAPDESRFFDGYPTYVVGHQLESKSNFGLLNDIALFSGGEMYDLAEARSMIQAVARVTGTVSGAFVLLYDMPVPASSGKAAEIKIDATITLPAGPDGEAQVAEATFRGTLEVRLATGP